MMIIVAAAATIICLITWLVCERTPFQGVDDDAR